jgi:hypothetical protein
VATALAHLREPIPPLPDSVPPSLAATVTRALAKDPADRFVDAAAFAAALRSDEMPTMPAPAPAPTATQVLPATTVLPPETKAAAAVAAPVPPPNRRTKLPPWPWLLFAAIVLIGVIALIAALSNGDTPDSPTKPAATKTKPTSPTTTASSPSAPTSSPDDTVTVNEDDYIGEDVKQAEQELTALGLDVSTQEVSNDGTQQENTVEGLDPPNGELHQGDPITISYWGKPTVTEPTPPGHTKKPHGPKKSKGKR